MAAGDGAAELGGLGLRLGLGVLRLGDLGGRRLGRGLLLLLGLLLLGLLGAGWASWAAASG